MPHQPGHAAPTDFSDVANMPLPSEAPTQDVIGGFAADAEPVPFESDIHGSGLATTAPGAGGVPYAPGRRPVVYHEGDEFRIWRSLAPEERVRLQQQLVAIGMASNVVYGDFDGGASSGTRGAMRALLGMANVSGTDWIDTLNRIATSGATQEQVEQFEPKPYLAPDYATLAQRVKGTFRQELGRDPDDYELQQLAEELGGFDRMAHEAEQELARMAHEQGVTPGVQEAGQVRGVDPLSRFQELFEKRYAGELDVVEDRATFTANAPRVDAIIDSGVRA